jgi:hypothetical protein
MKKEVVKLETLPSPVRSALRLAIKGAGYRYYKDFAAKVGYSAGRFYRILNGHEDYVAEGMQKRMAKRLNLTLPQLKRLL